jgi:hypothetical protein
MKRTKSFGDRYTALAEKLKRVAVVRQLDPGDDTEAWGMAHGLLDIEEEAAEFSRTLAELESAESPVDMQSVLFNLRLQLDHIRYHMDDMAFFREVSPSDKANPVIPPFDE